MWKIGGVPAGREEKELCHSSVSQSQSICNRGQSPDTHVPVIPGFQLMEFASFTADVEKVWQCASCTRCIL